MQNHVMAGTLMVDGVILFQIQIDDFMKKSKNKITSVKRRSVVKVLLYQILKSFSGGGIFSFVYNRFRSLVLLYLEIVHQLSVTVFIIPYHVTIVKK